MFDAVHVVVGAVRELNRSQEIGVKPLSCTSPQIWQHGTSLMNYLRMVSTHTNTQAHTQAHEHTQEHTHFTFILSLHLTKKIVVSSHTNISAI